MHHSWGHRAVFLYKTWRDWIEFPQDLVSSSYCFLKANQPSLKCFSPMLSHLSCINDTFSPKVFCLRDMWYDKDILSSLSSHLSECSLPKSFGISVGNHQNITSMFIPWQWETSLKRTEEMCVYLRVWRVKGKSEQCRNSSCLQQQLCFSGQKVFPGYLFWSILQFGKTEGRGQRSMLVMSNITEDLFP